MMVARLTESRRYEAIEVETPQPALREVRVRLIGSGVCASNIALWEGRPWFRYPAPPGSPGHEGWGYVDAVGEAVETIAPGEPVTLLSSRAFADYDVAPVEHVVSLPPQLAGRIFPGEPLACAMNIFARAAIEHGHNVAVVGVGFLGALLIRLAHETGARVVAISRRRFSLEIARSCGANEVIELTSDATAAAQRIAGTKGFERVIEATGSQQALDLASTLTAERGRLIIAGYHQDGSRQVNLQLWNWRGIDVINAHERQPAVYIDGIMRAIRAVCEGRLAPWPLLTHQFPLARINDAFETMVARPEGFVKAVVQT